MPTRKRLDGKMNPLVPLQIVIPAETLRARVALEWAVRLRPSHADSCYASDSDSAGADARTPRAGLEHSVVRMLRATAVHVRHVCGGDGGGGGVAAVETWGDVLLVLMLLLMLLSKHDHLVIWVVHVAHDGSVEGGQGVRRVGTGELREVRVCGG